NGVAKYQFQALSSLDTCITSPQREHNKRPVISYIGNVGLAQDLTTFVQAARRLPHIEFNIVGTGTDFKRIEEEVKRHATPNINLWGSVSWEEIPGVYTISDILYAQLTYDYSRAMPSKLYEYLSTGRFII